MDKNSEKYLVKELASQACLLTWEAEGKLSIALGYWIWIDRLHNKIKENTEILMDYTHK